jgi:hypothetical protein
LTGIPTARTAASAALSSVFGVLKLEGDVLTFRRVAIGDVDDLNQTQRKIPANCFRRPPIARP